ncbi:MAG: tyrosine-type recombinase/integrase [Acidobacteriota bacterium]
MKYTTSQEAVNGWIRHLEASRGRSPSTCRRYRQLVLQALEGMEVERLEDVTWSDLDRWLQRLFFAGRATSTRRAAVAALRGFFDWAVISGLVPTSPASRLVGPPQYQAEAPHLSVAEARRLIYGPRPGWVPESPRALRDRLLCALGYVLGLRVSEVPALRFDGVQVDPERGSLSVLVERGKWASSDVRMPVADALVSQQLEVYLMMRPDWAASESPWLFPSARGARMHPGSVGRIFKGMVAAAGIQPRQRRLSFHILRHSLATHLVAEAGWETKEVMAWMRHRDVSTTLRYVHARERQALASRWRKRSPLGRQGRSPAAAWQAEVLDAVGLGSVREP